MSGVGEGPMERLRSRLLWELEALEGELERMETGGAATPDASWAQPLYRRLIARRRRWLERLFPDLAPFSAGREACAGAYGP